MERAPWSKYGLPILTAAGAAFLAWRMLPADFFSSDGFMPHGHCYLWNPPLIRLHLISDALIALSYTTIPFTLGYFVRKRKDLPFSWMFICFGIFIIACGATHYMEIWTLWHPSYWLSGFIKAITALASVSTAYLLVRLMPQALSLPSPTQMMAATRKLEAEIADRNKTEAKFHGLLESAPDAMLIVDAKGDILIVNGQTETLFGYKREEVVNRPLDILIPERYRRGHAEHRQDYFGEPRTRPMGAGLDLYARRKDGSEFPVEISLSPLVTPEGTLAIAAVRDITERKSTEKALRRSKEDAETAYKELEAFSYSVAHDLRAPLRKISTFGDALQDGLSDTLSAQNKDHLQRIQGNIAQMGKLIDGLLSLSRIVKQELWRESVDLSALAQAAADELSKASPERRVEFVIASGLSTYGTPDLMRLVVYNLLDNAWKFTQKHSQARIEFGKMDRAGETVYFVRDDGAGFDMAYVDKLFGPFKRLHSIGEFPGSGIGLATVERVVRRHGGRIWAEAQVEHGATFYFTLGTPGAAF